MDSVKIAHNMVLEIENCSRFFCSCLPEYSVKPVVGFHRWYFPLIHSAIDCFAKNFGRI